MFIKLPQVCQELEKFFQNKLQIFMLLIVLFIAMPDMQYWKCNNMRNAWKIKKNLKI